MAPRKRSSHTLHLADLVSEVSQMRLGASISVTTRKGKHDATPHRLHLPSLAVLEKRRASHVVPEFSDVLGLRKKRDDDNSLQPLRR